MPITDYIPQPSTLDTYNQWYANSIYNSGNQATPGTNWGGIASTFGNGAINFTKGGNKALGLFNNFQKDTGNIASASALTEATNVGDLASMSKTSSFLSGGMKAIGGVAGITSLAETAMGYTNWGREADSQTQSTAGKAMKWGGAALGALGTLGVAGLGPAGAIVGGLYLADNALGRTADTQHITSARDTGSGYTGNYIDALSGHKTDLLGNLFGSKRKKTSTINANINYDENILASASLIGQKSAKDRMAASNSIGDTIQKDQQQLQGGFNQGQMRLLSSKKGTKLSLKNIKRKVNNKITTKKIQEGGEVDESDEFNSTDNNSSANTSNDSSSNNSDTTNSKNVIPEGALHARKNNIDMEGVTHKGIPVVTQEENGKIKQHAEIEREELIFHKELTDKIEALYKQYKEGDDKALLEAGKILTYEILENTDDNTGLLNK